MLRRIGVDTVAVDRIAAAVARSGSRFLDRVFTAEEQAHCGRSAERLAGRWAAKEAVIKCFDRTPICFPRRRVEILSTLSGAPRVALLGRDAMGARVEVTITHQAGIAVAVAMLEMPGPEERPLVAPESVQMPIRPPQAHKGTFGRVVVVAGSLGLTGAAYLAATAAARAGAGTVRLLVASSIHPILAAKCTEVMATPIQEVAPGALGHSAYESVMRHLTGATAAVVGPGLGSDRSTARLVHDISQHARAALVLDADALNALAGQPRLRGRLGARRVLTPHPGELARLLGRPVGERPAERIEAATSAAESWGAVVVLKGARTVVAAPQGRLVEDPHVVPALATGGTGDVLAGLIGGLLAQGLEPFAAAVTGVYVHGEAGRRISVRQGDSGLLASELLPEIPIVMHQLREGGF